MKNIIWISVVACLFAFSACGPSGNEMRLAEKQRKEAEQKAYNAAFKVGVMPTLDCLPLYLLCDSVLYDTACADIRLVSFTAQMDCDTAMVGKNVDACISDLVRAERLHIQGVPIRWFAATNAYWNLYANKEEKIDTIGNLGDCNIAMTRYSVTDFLTAEVLRRAKLKRPALPVQINDILVREKMATEGSLESFWFTEPMATKMRLEGHKLLFTSQDLALHPGIIVLIDKPAKDFHHSEKQKAEFRKAYNRAVALINKNGLIYYSDIIIKYMGVDSKTVVNLPKLKFEPARSPRESDLKAFRRIKAY